MPSGASASSAGPPLSSSTGLGGRPAPTAKQRFDSVSQVEAASARRARRGAREGAIGAAPSALYWRRNSRARRALKPKSLLRSLGPAPSRTASATRAWSAALSVALVAPARTAWATRAVSRSGVSGAAHCGERTAEARM
eukprot:4619123-Pyramimonas_sp.AAC.1